MCSPLCVVAAKMQVTVGLKVTSAGVFGNVKIIWDKIFSDDKGAGAWAGTRARMGLEVGVGVEKAVLGLAMNKKWLRGTIKYFLIATLPNSFNKCLLSQFRAKTRFLSRGYLVQSLALFI